MFKQYILKFLLCGVLSAINLPTLLAQNNVVILNCQRSLKMIRGEGKTYVIKKNINLKGRTIIFPKNSIVNYKKGCLKNGQVIFNNATLTGNVAFEGRVSGTVTNDTIQVSWFKNKDFSLTDCFNMSEGKIVFFEKGCRYEVNNCFQIPSCTIFGNGSTIEVGNIKEHSPVSDYIKIRNKHYDGGGTDSFSIYNLNFVSTTDGTFLFSISHANDVKLLNCSFKCYGTSEKCMHSLDVRGNVDRLLIDDCEIVNMTGAKAGGGLWLRSFGSIRDVEINRCRFQNNTTDETFALNAVVGDICNVKVIGCSFEYYRNNRCPDPHVFWGMTKTEKGNNHNVLIKNNTLRSDYLPSFLINTSNAKNVILEHNYFEFSDFTMLDSKLTTNLFNGEMSCIDNEIVVKSLIGSTSAETQINIFSGDVTVRQTKIFNDCKQCHLGASCIYDSEIYFDNSQLFNGSLPLMMKGNHIRLGTGTPSLAANPYSHRGKCCWEDNVIESDCKVFFNLMYEGVKIESKNNLFKGVNMQGIKVN